MSRAALPRYDSIQLLRAVAAISVLVMHVFASHESHASRGLSTPLGIDASVGNAGVDLFFVITGFLMARISGFFEAQALTPGEFFRRRLVRLVPPYWFYTTLLLAAYLVVPQAFGRFSTSVPHAMGSYLFVPVPNAHGSTAPVISVGWTLNLEMFFYLVFGLALFLPLRRRVPAIGAAILALFAAGFVTDTCWAGWLGNQLYLEVLFGLVIGWATLRGRRPAEPLAWIAMVGGVALIGLFPHTDFRALTWGLCGMLAVLGAVSIERPLPAPLVALGDASYSIYLSHVITVPAAFKLLLGRVGDPLALTLLVVALSTAGGVAAYFVVERPLIAWTRRAFGGASLRLRAAR